VSLTALAMHHDRREEDSMRTRSIAAILLLSAAGCGATIRSSVANNADLSKYRTYAFYTPPDRQGQPETIADQTIKSSLKQNLATRGMTESMGTNPEFLVSYHVKKREKIEVSSWGYGYWGYGYGGSPVDVNQYTEGTLIVDFIDPQTMQVFFRGTATAVLNHPDTPDMGKIENAVGQIVDRYPTTVAATPRQPM
jgi:hypothetical protein